MKLVLLSLLVAIALADTDIVPGLSSGFGCGYDPITETPKAPVFKWNFGSRMTWTYPLSRQSYLTPDELWAQNMPQMASKTEYTICKDLKDYKDKKWSWSSWSIGFGVFSFDMSKSAGLMTALLSDHNRTVFVVDQEFDLYLLTSWPYEVMKNQENTAVQNWIARLPKDYNYDTYAEFIQEFGTHYVYRARMGGMLSHYFSVSNDLIASKSASWVQEQVAVAVAIYYVTVGFSWGHSDMKTKEDSTFKASTITRTMRYGGVDAVLDKNDFKGWYKTLIQNPTMIRPELKPLSDLCADPQIKANLLRAITEYNNKKPNIPPRYTGLSDPALYEPDDVQNIQIRTEEQEKARVELFLRQHPEWVGKI